jgi:tetratricopeptide (TPR) repeat protein
MTNAQPDLRQGMALHQAGKLDEARRCYERVLQTRPSDPNALHLLGLVCLASHQLNQAAVFVQGALKGLPRYAEAHCSLGRIYHAQNKLAEAIASYRQAVALKPDYLEAICQLATAHEGQGNLDEAIAAYQRALVIKPDFAGVHGNLGNAFLAQGNPDLAIAAYRRALAIDPNIAEFQNSLGIALKTLGKFDDAVAAYRRALALNPNYVEAYSNLGSTLHAQGKLTEALASYHRAESIDPSYAEAHYNESLVQLLLGKFSVGWKKYEHRKREARGFARPEWRGETSLAGKSILLYAEQGLGDTLQFIRYAPLVAERGATVYLEVQPSVKDLLSPFPHVKATYGKGDALPDFDVCCPLLSLPFVFGTQLKSIPAYASYLRAPAESVERWRTVLAPVKPPRVGVVWAGNPFHKNDRHRSIPLEQFQAIFDEPSVRFVGLQKLLKKTDGPLLARRPEVMNLSPEIKNFSDTAAIIAELDLIITVDTSVAHLSGALGKPTWVLLPVTPDWRWLLNRDDSPWYPTVRLFRQPAIHDWDSVLQRVRSELKQFAAACVE